MVEKALQFDNRKNMFWIAAVCIGLSVCLYIYFITATVKNVVLQKQLSLEVGNLSEEVSVKEFSSIALKDAVTLQYAESLGFAEAQNKVFITPTSVSFV